jgi:hypothetical protein
VRNVVAVPAIARMAGYPLRKNHPCQDCADPFENHVPIFPVRSYAAHQETAAPHAIVFARQKNA